MPSMCKATRGGAPRKATAPAACVLAVVGAVAAVTLKTALHSAGFVLPSSRAISTGRGEAVALRARGGGDEDYDDNNFAGMILDDRTLEVGQEVSGVIVKFQKNFQGIENGLRLDFGTQREGFVPIGRIAEGPRMEQPSKNSGLKEGDLVKAWVCENTDSRFSLSLVRSKVFPRADVALFKDFDPTEYQTGTVVAIFPFGAFVALKPPNGEVAEAQGLLPLGGMLNKEAEFTEGQEVKVRIASLDLDSGRMSLSEREPEKSNEEKYTPFSTIPDDEWVTGIVKNFQNFGAFVQVTLESGAQADGLLPNSQISEKFVEDPEEFLEMDQELKVRIVSVDIDAGRMSLSLRVPIEEADEPDDQMEDTPTPVEA